MTFVSSIRVVGAWHRRPEEWAALLCAAIPLTTALTTLWNWTKVTAGGPHAYAFSIPMAPSTAGLITLCSAALAFVAMAGDARLTAVASRFAAATTAIGAVAVMVLAWARPTPSDVSGMVSLTGTLDVPIGRMSPITAGLLVLFSVGLWLQVSRRDVLYAVGRIIAALGAAGCGLIVLAYAAGAPLFYRGSIVPVALSTGLAVGALNLALLFITDVPRTTFRYLFGSPDATGPKVPRAEAYWFVAVTALLLAVVLLGAIGYLHGYRDREQERIRRELMTLADFQKNQLVKWREEQNRSARLLSHALYVPTREAALVAEAEGPGANAEMRKWLEHVRSTEGYAAIGLFDAVARPWVVDPPSAVRRLGDMADEVRIALGREDVELRDFGHGVGNAVAFYSVVPFRAGERLLGTILIELDPAAFLLPLLRNWPTPTMTGETVLVRKAGGDVLYLTGVRHGPNQGSILRQPLSDPRLVAARVVQGEEGVIPDGFDYRGVAVIAVGRNVPNTPWALITKVDVAEAFAPMRRHGFAVLSTTCALGGAVLSGAGLIWRGRRNRSLRLQLQAEQAREALSKRLAMVMENANDAILMLTEDGRILEANARALDWYGYTPDEMRRLTIADLRAPTTLPELSHQLHTTNTRDGGMFETEHRRRDGVVFPVEVSSRIVEIEGQRIRMSIVRDIRQRKEHEVQIERLNRLYLALSRINQATVASHSREDLFASVCRALVQSGVIKMAWVGWINATTKQVEPIAHFGDTGHYLDAVRVYADDRPEGHGPTGTAIQEARTYVCSDFMADPRTLPWRETAARHGFRSSLSIPFFANGRIVGAITAYATQPNLFGPKEVVLCNEASDAVSFALDSFEREAKRAEAEARQRAADERVRVAFATGPDGYLIVKRNDGRIVEVNQQMERLYGYTRAEMIGRTTLELGLWGDPQAWDALVAELNRNGRVRNMEILARHRNGAVFHVSYSVSVLAGMGEPLMVGVLADITEAKRAQEKLRASEVRFRTLIEHAPVAIGLSRESRTIYVNQKYCELFRIARPADVVGAPVLEIWAPECRDAVRERSQRRSQGELVPPDFEGIAVRASGERFPAHVAATVMQLPDGPVSVAFYSDLTERKQAEQRVTEFQQRLHELTQHLQRIREDESLRIAQVVHDELGQQLTALKMDMHSLERGIEQVPEPAANALLEKVVSATALLDETVLTVQRIAAELRPSLLDKLGLPEALRHDCEVLQQRTGLACRFNAPDSVPRLPQSLAIACYRIVQESLTNVVRHAKAKSVEVELRADGDVIVVAVRDDGRGIAPAALTDLRSLGLLGMQERALAFGGNVTVERGAERGTIVRATFPRSFPANSRT